MRIAIVEDELALANEVVDVLTELRQKEVTVFTSGEQFLFEYEEHVFDLVVLDIQLMNMNGLETAKALRKLDQHVAIVFLTNDPSFVFEGYEVDAIRYWLKPVQKEKLEALLASLSINKPYITWQSNQELYKLYEDDILYLESEGHYVLWHHKGQIYRKKANFRDECAKLSDDFLVCHRSYCINLNHVHAFLKDTCHMDDDSQIPVSRAMKSQVQLALMKKCKEDLLCD